MKVARLFLPLIAVALSAQALAAPMLIPHTAQYKVKISMVSGVLNTELRRTGDGYVANHVISPTGVAKLLVNGSMDVTSEFSSDNNGVKPVRFRSIDTIRDDPDENLIFNWDTNEVSGTVGEDAVLLKLDGISHDSVSLQYQLMHDLMNGGPSEQYVLFDLDKMRIANVTDAGTKKIKTKAGTFDAVGIRHQKEGSSRTTTMWCVEELGFLPVIIEQHRKGKVNFRATLVKYTPTQE